MINIFDPNVRLFYIDLFCGFGGATKGVEDARDEDGNFVAKVIACVNHDEKAINAHYLNHPGVKHFTEDIRVLDMKPLIEIVKEARIKYPNALFVLWASLECTNFSNAKGGKPRDADSRTLAEHLNRYVEALKPDYIKIENVREFMAWGPLDSNGKPLSRKNGLHFMRWCRSIKEYGYDLKYRVLNCADYGVPQSRKRLFMIFAKDGLPIKFPTPTHSKEPYSDQFGKTKKWIPVSKVLDLSDTGESIFNRKERGKKELVDNTLKRIYSGLLKEVANGESAFLAKYYSTNKPETMICPLSSPAGTIKTKDSHSLVTTSYMVEYYGAGKTKSVNAPSGTVTTRDRNAIVSPIFFIDKQYGFSAKNHQSLSSPSGTITTVPKLALVKAERYLLNPSWGGNNWPVNKPCFTIIARMDKAPPYIVTTDKGEMAIKIMEGDSDIMKKIKMFMAAHGIVDIKMRMLKVKELLQIQGFPPNYKMGDATQTEQKKFTGNAVPPLMVQSITMAIVEELKELLPSVKTA